MKMRRGWGGARKPFFALFRFLSPPTVQGRRLGTGKGCAQAVPPGSSKSEGILISDADGMLHYYAGENQLKKLRHELHVDDSKVLCHAPLCLARNAALNLYRCLDKSLSVTSKSVLTGTRSMTATATDGRRYTMQQPVVRLASWRCRCCSSTRPTLT